LSGRALIGALLLLASPAPAQTDRAAPPQIPAEALAPSEEARELFDQLPSQPLTAEMVEARMGPVGSAAARPMDAVVEQMLERGEPVPEWQTLGVEVRAVIGARAGGLAGNMSYGEGQFGPSFTYFVDRPIDAFVPASWVLVGRHGAPVAGEAGEDIQVDIVRISPKVIFAERAVTRRMGNAHCRVRGESRLYADPQVPASEMDLIALVMTMRVLATRDAMSVCIVFIPESGDVYRARNFDAEGRPLPNLDAAQATFRIVPLPSS
jgi:hypothetical protein